MRSCEVDDPVDCLGRHAFEDLVRDLLRGVIVGIFENGPNRQAGVFDEPGSGYLAANPFDIIAFRPVYVFHVGLWSSATRCL